MYQTNEVTLYFLSRCPLMQMLFLKFLFVIMMIITTTADSALWSPSLFTVPKQGVTESDPYSCCVPKHCTSLL